MTSDGVELWQQAALRADLSGAEIGLLLDAVHEDNELHADITRILGGLDPSVAAAFIRRFAAEVVSRGPSISARSSVKPALNAIVIDAEPFL